MGEAQAETALGKEISRAPSGDEARKRLLTGLPVEERRLKLAGISTAVLEGGEGPPIVLLHGPVGYAAKWLRVIPELVKSNRVIVSDLPGHGTSEVTNGSVDPDRVLAWLDDLIECTCPTSAVLVGQILGGAIAARFAAERRGRLSHLVLCDTLGLAPFQPTPEFGAALTNFVRQPDEDTHDHLWKRCVFDLDALRHQLGTSWDSIKAYNLDRASAPSLTATQQSLMEQFGLPAIPPEELERITVPTTLIWGRHDLATSLAVAEAASARYGWPLHVIENAAGDPPIEQPEAFLHVLHATVPHASGKESEVQPAAEDTHRPVEMCETLLPPGMTRACAQELARLFKHRADPECWVTNIDLAVAAFEVLEAHRHET